MVTSLSGRIIAHRGLWVKESEQNSDTSIIRALKSNFGLETDFRDHLGKVFVSHDPILENTDSFGLIDILTVSSSEQLLALNLKSSGLLKLISEETIQMLHTKKYFFFDLSFPEVLQYKSLGLSVAARVSEFEKEISFETNHIWLDSFNSDWWLDSGELIDLLTEFNITVVSPELHGRDKENAWKRLTFLYRENSNLSICTDHPLDFWKRISND